jgi:hypothetical protein
VQGNLPQKANWRAMVWLYLVFAFAAGVALPFTAGSAEWR